jgi:HPt (histidine-containing phosphotransfer) domain-containing protein
MNLNNARKYTDLSYLHSVSKGNVSFEQRMLNTFISQMGTDMQKLKQAVAVKDWEAIHMIAHKMKPSLQFVGLLVLQADVHTLESLGKQKAEFEKVSELVSHVSAIMEIAIEEVKDELLSFGKNN